MTGIFYIDSTIFANANRVYTEAGLNVVAPDGYYVFGGVYRQQVNGNLLPETAVCPECEATTTTSTTTSTTTTSTTTSTTTTTQPPTSSTTTSTTTGDPYHYYDSNQYACPDCNNPIGTYVVIKSVNPLTPGNWVTAGGYKFHVLYGTSPHYMATEVDSMTETMVCGCPSTTTTSTTTQPVVYSAYFNTGTTGYDACNSMAGITLYWVGSATPNGVQVYTDEARTQPYYVPTMAAYQGNVYSISNGYIFTSGVCSDYTSTTTTTTTTTQPPAGCIEVGVYPPLVSGTTHTVTYIVCPGGTQNTVNVTYGGNMIAICTTAEGIIYDNKDAVVAQTYPTGNICSGDTTTTTSTTTSTTTTLPPAQYFGYQAIHPQAQGGTDYVRYIDEFGVEQIYTLVRDDINGNPCEAIYAISIIQTVGAVPCTPGV